MAIAMLIEREGCVFDERELSQSFGHDDLDPVAQEAYVNHIHFTGRGRRNEADARISAWAAELTAKWPQSRFRIYRAITSREVTIRFHMVRAGLPNWAEEGVEVIEVPSPRKSR